MPVRIGILGGTFNPVHVGHLAMAEGAREALRLERVLFIPANVPPHKDALGLAPCEDRLRMLHLALDGNPDFEVSDVECERPAPSYTVDTLKALREGLDADAEMFFIIGADSVPELPTWHRIDDLVHMCTIVPVNRPGISLENMSALAKAIGADEAEALLRRLIHLPLVDVSSTEIRKRVRTNRSIRYLVPEQVRAYILARGLYS